METNFGVPTVTQAFNKQLSLTYKLDYFRVPCNLNS